MMFVVRRVRCSAPVRPRRCTVSVSSSPSRTGRRRAGVVALQRLGQPLEHARRAVGRIEVPRIGGWVTPQLARDLHIGRRPVDGLLGRIGQDRG